MPEISENYNGALFLFGSTQISENYNGALFLFGSTQISENYNGALFLFPPKLNSTHKIVGASKKNLKGAFHFNVSHKCPKLKKGNTKDQKQKSLALL